ncbi:hypothetical protein ACWEQL_37580 [Kitasatospora sp. NPDC004240]
MRVPAAAALGALTARQAEGLFALLVLVIAAAALVLLEPWTGRGR